MNALSHWGPQQTGYSLSRSGSCQGFIFTGSGPIVVLTPYASLTAPNFVEKLAAKGIRKFIAYEMGVEEVKKKYGR